MPNPHRFFPNRGPWASSSLIPGRDSGLRQTETFRQLILGPVPCFPIRRYDRKNIFHGNHHLYPSILRKLYFDLSLHLNYFYRIPITINLSILAGKLMRLRVSRSCLKPGIICDKMAKKGWQAMKLRSYLSRVSADLVFVMSRIWNCQRIRHSLT